jgi:hypothetical protein
MTELENVPTAITTYVEAVVKALDKKSLVGKHHGPSR